MPQQGDLYRRWPADDIPNFVVFRLAGLSMSPSGGARWDRRRALCFALVSAAPLLLMGVAIGTGLAHELKIPSYVLWTAWFVVLDVFGVGAHWYVCRLFLGVAEDLDPMLTPAGRTAVHAWLDTVTSRWRQLRAMAVGGALFPGCLLVANSLSARGVRLGHGPFLFMSLTSYAAVAWTGALFGSCGYWLLKGGHLTTLVAHRGNVKLLWSAPARTPGMETLSSAYRLASLMVTLGTVAGLFPVLTWAYSGPPGATSVSVVKWAVITVTLLMDAAFSLVPQWRLSMAIRAAKAESLRKISELLPEEVPTARRPVDEQTARNIELLAMVASSPSSTITGQTVAGVILALAGATVPWLAQVVF
ncbi:hypothetical protein [Streptomyces sp. NPDC059009]|uniref:hypothetical protein n=1 Tax=Streptomyces sp. NPDC059009 TaxID=3346694 RepID=UPI0036B4BA62